MPHLPASDALSHIRVIDLTRVRSGPTAVRQLADWGADVIKVEAPESVEPDGALGASRHTSDFQNLHRNKRSITLNLKKSEAKEILMKLVEKSDVVVENFRPDVKKRLGIDYETLSALNPDLIYCSISGYGQTGPYKNKKVYDPLIQGTVGIPNAQNTEKPQLVKTIIYDKVTGMTGAQAISAALFQREKGEGGQYLPISMMESALYYNWPDLMMNHTFDEGGENIGELADLFEVYENYILLNFL